MVMPMRQRNLQKPPALGRVSHKMSVRMPIIEVADHRDAFGRLIMIHKIGRPNHILGRVPLFAA